jgi:iron(III) transport system substrate-binding protein
VQISFPKEGIGSAAECIGLVKGNKNGAAARKLIDWATSPEMQSLLAPSKINFLPAHPKVAPDPDLVAVLKQAKIIEIDDRWAGDNRKRIIDRWVAEVLNAG